MTKQNHTDFLLEDMNGKFDRLIDIMAQVRDEMKGMAKQTDLEEVKTDVKVIKVAVKDVSHQVATHEEQITELKAA